MTKIKADEDAQESSCLAVPDGHYELARGDNDYDECDDLVLVSRVKT